MPSQPVFIHAQPWPDEQHRGARGSQQVGSNCADKQEQHVGSRCSLTLDGDVYSAGYHKERPDERDKAHILSGGVKCPLLRMQGQGIIKESNRAKTEGDLDEMFAPPIRKK